MPYDDDLEVYFNKIDNILKDTDHQLIAIGQKSSLVNTENFKSKIELYKSVSDVLKEL